MRRTLAVLVGLSAVACAPKVMQVSLAPGDVDLATTMLGQGASTIKGSALLRQRGGNVVTCAGNDVYPVPATPSAGSELQRVFGGDKGYVARGGGTFLGGGTLVEPPQPNRKSVCNAQGFFTFPNVRAGKWYVMTSIVWTVSDNYQGGSLLGSAEIADGQEAEIVLSQ